VIPAARIAAAIEVLADIEARRRPVADALKDWGLSHRFAGSKDRSAIGNLVYDGLRWRLSSAFVMGADTPRAIVLGAVARHWGLAADALAAMFAAGPHAPEPLTEDETRRLASPGLDGAPDHVRADVPEWLAPRFERMFGPDWVEEGAALALRPPLDMRANRLKSDRAKVAKALARFGAAETPWSPDGIRIAPTATDGRHPNVTVEPAFQKGWFEVQDEGSQIAALMVAARPGEQVLDLCAGAGGKTLALAAMMANKGQVHATDSDRARLAPIFERLKRAGARNVQVRNAGSDLADLAGRMDAVLIDAPCTGTGVWRRRPDAKWRLTERALGERIAEQEALLGTAGHYLKPGGRLVYVTCSLLPDEDEDRVSAFLAANPEFSLVAPRAMIDAAGIGAGLADAAPLNPAGLVLTARRTATDGFFIAMMRRT
jgi:16S rRNA (cytosine967-C5)-methyltransferase